MNIDHPPLLPLVVDVGALMAARTLRLVCAESCTGGWIAKIITDMAGVSSWFEASLTVYSNAAKQRLLGVPSATLRQWGAVSSETAAAMVSGALALSAADIALAVTGIAGPSGGDAHKPVGTVWIAWQHRLTAVHTQGFFFHGNRDQIRYQSVVAALKGLIDYLDPSRVERDQGPHPNDRPC